MEKYIVEFSYTISNNDQTFNTSLLYIQLGRWDLSIKNLKYISFSIGKSKEIVFT